MQDDKEDENSDFRLDVKNNRNQTPVSTTDKIKNIQQDNEEIQIEVKGLDINVNGVVSNTTDAENRTENDIYKKQKEGVYLNEVEGVTITV